MYSMKSVGKTMKINIRVVDCFALFGAHQHDIIMQICTYMITMGNQPPFLRRIDALQRGHEV